jgi:hypothetical protein
MSHAGRTKGIFLAAALFLTGAAVGALGLEAWHMMHGGPFGRMARLGPAAFITERMSHDLNLTPDQLARIRPIIKEMVAKQEQSREPCAAEGEAIAEKYLAQVRSLLTPEQVVRHDAIMKRVREHGMLMPPPPPGPFPPGEPPGPPPPGQSFGPPPGESPDHHPGQPPE